MASIIIHLDRVTEDELHGFVALVQSALDLVPGESIVRSSMGAHQEVVDAAFDNRFDDLIEYVNDIQDITGSPRIGVLPKERYWAMRADAEDGHAQPFGEHTYGIVDEEEGGVILYVHQNNVEFTLNNLRK